MKIIVWEINGVCIALRTLLWGGIVCEILPVGYICAVDMLYLMALVTDNIFSNASVSGLFGLVFLKPNSLYARSEFVCDGINLISFRSYMKDSVALRNFLQRELRLSFQIHNVTKYQNPITIEWGKCEIDLSRETFSLYFKVGGIDLYCFSLSASGNTRFLCCEISNIPVPEISSIVTNPSSGYCTICWSTLKLLYLFSF